MDNYAVNRLSKSSDPIARMTATVISDAIKSGNLIKIVTGVGSKGATVIKLK